MKKIIITILAALLAGSSVNAQSASGTCSAIGCTALVKNMIAFGTGTVEVFMDADQSSLNCTLQSDGSMILYSTDAGVDRIYSTLLSAQLTDKKVFVRIIDGSAPCHINYARLAL